MLTAMRRIVTMARRAVGFSSRSGITPGPYRRSRTRSRGRVEAAGRRLADRPPVVRALRARMERLRTMPPKIPTMPQASDWRRVLETGMQFTELRRSQARAIVSDLVAQGHLARDQMA